MPETVRRPRFRLEALGLNRSAVDDTLAVRSIVDPAERVAHLSEDNRVAIGSAKILVLELIGVRTIPSVILVVAGVVRDIHFVADSLGQFAFDLQQSPFVVLSLHLMPPVRSFSA